MSTTSDPPELWRTSGIIMSSSPTTVSGSTPNPTKGNMGEPTGLFPVSVIIAGFCIMSFAYIICFCCCLVQFLMRQGRRRNSPSTNGSPERPPGALSSRPQKNEKLRNQLWNQYENSLKRFRKQGTRKSLRDASCAGACSICFDEYSGDPAQILVGYLKPCGHYFHFDCIWQWLEARQSCPLCRTAAHLKETDIKGLALRHIDEYKSMAKETERKSELQRQADSGATEDDAVITIIETVKSTVVRIDPAVDVADQAGPSSRPTSDVMAASTSNTGSHLTSSDACAVPDVEGAPGCSAGPSNYAPQGAMPGTSEDEHETANGSRHEEHADTSPIVTHNPTASRNESHDNPAFEQSSE